MKGTAKHKLFNAFATLALLLPVGLGTGSVVRADETTVDITLHKLAYKDATKVPNPALPNTGESMTFSDSQPLDGAQFTVYDVTDHYYDLRAGKPAQGDTPEVAALNAKDATAKIESETINGIPMNSDKTTPNTTDYKELSSVETGKAGVAGAATFAGLALKDSNGKDKVYLFLETKTPTQNADNNYVVSKAAPMVVSMPVYKVTGNTGDDSAKNINTDVQLYPKNVIKENKKTLDGVKNSSDTSATSSKNDADKVPGESNVYNVDGQNYIDYSIKVNVPSDVATQKAFNVIDTASKGLTYVPHSLKISGAELTATDELALSSADQKFNLSKDYTVVLPNKALADRLNLDYTFANGAVDAQNTFEVVFNNQAEDTASKIASKELTITYSMKLTDSAVPDQKLGNKVYFDFNHVPNIPNEPNTPLVPPVTPPDTVETGGYKFHKVDSQSKKSLAGATFNVKQGSQVAKFKKVNDEYMFLGWNVSEGSADITSTATDNINISIKGLKYGTYSLEEATAPDGYAKLADPISFTVTEGKYNDNDSIKEVANTPKGILPSTGGMGIYAFVAVGIVAIAGVGFYFLKGRKQTEA